MPLPEEGAYAVLRLLAPGGGRSSYVGYIHEILSFPDSARSTHTVRVRLLSSSGPGVPVCPTHDPDGRQALRPSAPLPWTEAWHASALANVRIRLQVNEGLGAPAVVLSGDEMYEHDLAVEEEAVEAKETRRTEWKASLGDDSAEEVGLVGAFTADLASSSSNLANSRILDSVSEETTDDEDSHDNYHDEDEAEVYHEDDPDAGLPLLELVSYDLALVPVLPDPWRLFDEIATAEAAADASVA